MPTARHDLPARSDGGVKVPVLLAAAAAWSWRLLVVAAAGTMLVYALIQLYVVVVPVILALFLAAVLEPLVARLRRRRWPPALATATVFIGTLVGLGLVFSWIGAEVADELDDVGDRVSQGVQDVREWLQGEPLNLSPERLEQLEGDLRNSFGAGAGSGLARRARDATEVLGGFVLLLFTLFFVMKDGFRMADWFKERIAPAQRADAVAVTNRARRVMRLYLVATALTGLIDGVLIGIALLILGVPLVLPLAVLTFLGGFFPLVGATVAGLIAALVAMVDAGFTTALLVVGATILVQQIEGNLLQPLILERAVRLHPLVTVVAVGAGLLIGGLLGAFLSVPLVAIVAQTCNYFRTKDLEEAPPEEAPPEEAHEEAHPEDAQEEVPPEEAPPPEDQALKGSTASGSSS
ncbi:MAG: AI-2E family transporter [Actinomycetota bacterium]|nr:AI-2E family transporter [Actinomycetota bacterium]